jgi:hypothetical protein
MAGDKCLVFQNKKKKEQDSAFSLWKSEWPVQICVISTVRIDDRFLIKAQRREFTVCPGVGELIQ